MDDVINACRRCPSNLGFARVDHHRALRNGGEVVFGSGKTPDEIVAIVERLVAASGRALVTRLDPGAADVLVQAVRARRTTRARASRARSNDPWRRSRPARCS